MDEDPDNLDDDATLLFDSIHLDAAVNRIRTMNNSGIVATWNEMNEVSIYDTISIFNKMTNGEKKKKNKKKSKKKSFKLAGFKHLQEGFALDWSLLKKGVLASGGQDGQVFTYIPSDQTLTGWEMNKTPLQGHTGSVEDLQFSPTEDNVLASCSTDKSVKIWDLRSGQTQNSQITFAAHEGDVNVISWNSACSYLLASGGDEGAFKVWDLRYLKRGGTLTNVKWHKGPITSIQFQPREESVLAVSSADNKLSIWDFGVEKDEEESKDPANQEVPRQLMFLHQGQEDIKELR
jgi:ribosome assembly protein RRB1